MEKTKQNEELKSSQEENKMCSRCGKNEAQEDHACPYAQGIGFAIGFDRLMLCR